MIDYLLLLLLLSFTLKRLRKERKFRWWTRKWALMKCDRMFAVCFVQRYCWHVWFFARISVAGFYVVLDTSIGFFALMSTAHLGGRDVLGNQLTAFSPFSSLRDKGAPTLPSPFTPPTPTLHPTPTIHATHLLIFNFFIPTPPVSCSPWTDSDSNGSFSSWKQR